MKILQDSLLDSFGERIKKFGYKQRSKTQSYIRLMPEGKTTAHVAFIRLGADIDVTVDVGIRFQSVEDLGQLEAGLSQTEKRKTCSLGIELGHLIGTGQQRWTLTGHQDVDAVSQQIAEVFVAVGLPYIDNYSDMRTAFKMLAKNDAFSFINSPVHHSRWKRIIAMAVLTAHQDIPALVEKGVIFLSQNRDPSLSSFQRFSDLIASRHEAME